MKIVQINATADIGSTGRICSAISSALSEQQIENIILCSNPATTSNTSSLCYAHRFNITISTILSRIVGNWGFEGVYSTWKMLKELDSFNPDIIHLHNIHSHACNLSMLFAYIKKHNKKVIWTFHDCWAFTGYCMHYDMIGCDKWKEKCQRCPQRKEYSWMLDKSKRNFIRKKKILENAEIQVVVPSSWMAVQVADSFLGSKSVRVINNGINLEAFTCSDVAPTELIQYSNKHIVLGISAIWNERKGLDVFEKLADLLGNEYQIVLVGTNSKTEKKLSKKIACIKRTSSQGELSKLYSYADVFVNPTREDSFPTVNIEALACGIPVVTFATGGSPEIINSECGIVTTKNDCFELAESIKCVCENKPFNKEQCVKRANEFSNRKLIEEYLSLYTELCNE